MKKKSFLFKRRRRRPKLGSGRIPAKEDVYRVAAAALSIRLNFLSCLGIETP